MRKGHSEQVERWAKFVRDNPTEWKQIHTEFVNALFDKQERFYKKLLSSKEGKKKLARLAEMRRNFYK